MQLYSGFCSVLVFCFVFFGERSGRIWGPFFCLLFGLGWWFWVRTIIHIQTLKFPFRFAIQPGPSFIQQTLRVILRQKVYSKQEIQRESAPVLKEAEVNQETQYSVVSPK